MGLLETTAEELAAKAMKTAKETGDITVIDKVSKAIGDTSSTLQEAYLTAVRINSAAERGHEMLDQINAGETIDNLDNPNL